ncbi:MAG: hypothetical protein HFG49_16645 [Lachnospiraceae bacterium]|nr:hypothetical protein [Lachnospiraceae bacterium]
MMDLWVYGDGKDVASVSNASGSSTTYATDPDAAARYHAENEGGRDKNWVWAYANTNYDDYDDDMYWFYLNSKGQPTLANPENSDEYFDRLPYNYKDGDEIIRNGHNYGYEVTDNDEEYVLIAKSIKNKTYIFDDAGRMRSGLFALFNVDRGNSSNALTGYYYFTDDSSHGSTDGQMVTNKKMTIEIDGEDKSYYFDKKGRAYTDTIISSSFYGEDGALVDGYGDGSTYAAVNYTEAIKRGYEIYEKNKPLDMDPVYVEGYSKNKDDKYTILLLNGNGKIKKNGTVTDVDGYKVTVKDYKVTKIEDKN